jgi:ribA/ribD-fused uncharacterized protein
MVINQFQEKYFFLSNFYPCFITIDEMTYPSVEHAYQALKTFNLEQRKIISFLETPGQAKKAGRRVELRDDWELVKDEIMMRCLKEKFSNQFLKEKLLETNDEILVEGNIWHDNYWGSCFCSRCGYNGKNILGKLLMELREKYKEEKENGFFSN